VVETQNTTKLFAMATSLERSEKRGSDHWDQ